MIRSHSRRTYRAHGMTPVRSLREFKPILRNPPYSTGYRRAFCPEALAGDSAAGHIMDTPGEWQPRPLGQRRFIKWFHTRKQRYFARQEIQQALRDETIDEFLVSSPTP